MSKNKKGIIKNLCFILIIFLGIFTIIASGGGNSVSTKSKIPEKKQPPPKDEETKPPTISIISPEDGATYQTGNYLTFLGNAKDYKGKVLSGADLVWTSSKSSQPLGNGNIIEQVLLPSGEHKIQFRAKDSYGNYSAASVKIKINQKEDNTPPIVEIISPSDQSQFNAGEYIGFEAQAYDTEDGYLGQSYGKGDVSWYSTIDGQLSSETTFTKNNLSGGKHKIYVIAKDSLGLQKTSNSIEITIKNTPPEAKITWPPDKSTYKEGEAIKFTGTGFDPEDGNLYGSHLQWSSTGYTNGTFGYGSELQVDFLPKGTHTITLTVKDKNKGLDTDSIEITIN